MTSENITGAPTKIDLSITFDDEKEAGNVGKALMVDDDEFVTTLIDGVTVIGKVEAPNIEGARRAADDWLACLMAIVRDK